MTNGRTRSVRRARRRLWIGGFATFAWIIGWSVLSLCDADRCGQRLAPNEWGDWAAGIAAPVAFLWLILGYVQQGDELRQNTRALRLQERSLRLQVEELRQSVKEQRDMAIAAKRHAESAEFALLLQYQPQMVCQTVSADARSFWEATSLDAGVLQLYLFNRGGRIAHNPRIEVSDPSIVVSASLPQTWHPDHGEEVPVSFVTEGRLPSTFEFQISYIDMLGVRQHTDFAVSLPSDNPQRSLEVVKLRTQLRAPSAASPS